MTPERSSDLIVAHRHHSEGDVEHFEPTKARRRSQRRFAATRPGVRRWAAQPIITEAPGRTSVQARERLHRRSLVIADCAAAVLAIVLATKVLGEDAIKPATVGVLPVMVLIHKIAGLYDRDELVLKRSTLDDVPILFQLTGLFALLSWLLGDALISGQLEERQVLALWIGLFFGAVGARWLARTVATSLAATERCLVVGSPQAAGRVRSKLQDSKVNAEVVATLPLVAGRDLAVLDGVEPFRGLMTGLGIDRLILAPVSTDSADMLELIRIAKAVGVRVSVLPRMLEVVGSSVEFDDLNGLAMLGVRRFGLTRSSRRLKRTFDVVGATLGVAVISPVLAAVALAIRLDTRGPVLFWQTRVGRDGRHFRMAKFRSMVADAEGRKASLLDRNEAVGVFKIADDPRITRTGRFIRRTSLDELPQLFNVLRGEMSLVGPRPLIVDEDAQVEGMLRSRLHLTPGMTGPWQVLGSARIPMSEMVKIDYLYVAGWSLWTDIKLLLRTVPHMLSRGGM